MLEAAEPVNIEAVREAAMKVVQTHHRLVDFIKVGQKLPQIDTFIAKTLADLKCKSAFLHYVRGMRKFPSYACLSVNDCIVHGTAGYYFEPLKPGDILKVDIGVSYQGWIGDAAWTYVIKEISPETERLMNCGKEAIKRGIEQLKPGNILLDWSAAVQNYVEKDCGLFVIEALGGHSYGRKLHQQPYISNIVLPEHLWSFGPMVIKEGMLFAVEPMISPSTRSARHDRNSWPIFTSDGSNAVHYEHDIYITKDGPEVLTAGLTALPDIVG